MAVATRSALIPRIYQEFKTTLLAANASAPSLYREFATEVPSSSRSTLHAWIGNQTNVREWLGARVAKNLTSRTYEITNRKWELTYEFDRDQIDDDQSGLVASALMSARQFGIKYEQHKDLLCAQTLEAGLTTTGWDGQYFFDTDHPVDYDGIGSTATYANKLTASALTAATFNTAMVTMMGYKNENGTPMVMPGKFTLMVPPALALMAKTILEIDITAQAVAQGAIGTAGASRNPYYGMAKIVVNPFLSSTTNWYLLATDGIIKPLIFQNRRGVEVDELDENSEAYFKQERFYIGSSARYAVGFGLSQLALVGQA